MGAGASAKSIENEASRASAEALASAIDDLPKDVRARLAATLKSIESEESAQTSLKSGVIDGGGAGGAEIDYDDELAFELNKQEQLFLKCMKNRTEREAKKKREKQEKKEADQRKKAAAFENAFDNEVDRILDFFSEGFDIETQDNCGTTLLSEAAAGGAEDCVQILLGNGANPNRIGRHRRTPLWRAANAGHAEVVQLLLRAGGDPRTPDEVAAKPFDVANTPDVKALLECWDISVTETLKKAAGAAAKKLAKEQEEKEKKQKDEMQDAVEAAVRKTQIAKTEIARIQKLVVTYRQQRVSLAETGEVDKLNELTPLLEKAESELQQAKIIHQDLEWAVKRAKLKIRDFENKLQRKKAKAGEYVTKLEQTIFLKDVADVVLKDVGGKRREDGRWPLVFDPSGNCETFFRYNGSAVFTVEELAALTASSDKDDQERLLCAFLKHLKYGGALIIVLGKELANMSLAENYFNEIEKGFFGTLTDRSVLYSYLLVRRFLPLVPRQLQKDYCEYMFEDDNLSKFVLAFVVNDNEPDNEVLEKDCHMFYTIKVRDPKADEEDDD